MQITTGVDIIEVERIREAVDEIGESFINRIYTEAEVEYCNKSAKLKYQHFAARFAAKEAVFKALSKYIHSREDILWKEIEIVKDEDGRPKVNIENLKKYQIEKLESIDISISHIKDYAVASVVVMFND